jgi:phage baseplate assembly protein gpV
MRLKCVTRIENKTCWREFYSENSHNEAAWNAPGVGKQIILKGIVTIQADKYTQLCYCYSTITCTTNCYMYTCFNYQLNAQVIYSIIIYITL